MIIRFSETTKIETEKGYIWDYPMPKKDIGISYQVLSGRGPSKGKYCNTVCHEIYFITQGSGRFYLGEQMFEAKEKDVIIVEPNLAHHIETESLQYITITRPNWYEEQSRLVD